MLIFQWITAKEPITTSHNKPQYFTILGAFWARLFFSKIMVDAANHIPLIVAFIDFSTRAWTTRYGRGRGMRLDLTINTADTAELGGGGKKIMEKITKASKLGLITNRIIDILITIMAWIVVPLQIITTFILGLFVRLTFGLLLYPLSLIWVVLFLSPLIALSYIWERAPIARPFISVIGIPLAIIADTYVCLVPSMGELDSRIFKLLCCQTFPYSWRCYKFHKQRWNLNSDIELNIVFQRVSKDLAIQQYLDELIPEEEI